MGNPFLILLMGNAVLILMGIGFILILHFSSRNFAFKFLYVIYLLIGLFFWFYQKNFYLKINIFYLILYLILINVYFIIKKLNTHQIEDIEVEVVPLLLILCSIGLVLLWNDLLIPNKISSLVISVPILDSLLKYSLEVWISTFMEEWLYQFLALANSLVIILNGLFVYLLGLLSSNLRIKFGIKDTKLSRIQDGLILFLYLRFSIIYVMNRSDIFPLMKLNIWLLAVAGIYWLVQDLNKDVNAV